MSSAIRGMAWGGGQAVERLHELLPDVCFLLRRTRRLDVSITLLLLLMLKLQLLQAVHAFVSHACGVSIVAVCRDRGMKCSSAVDSRGRR